VGVVGKEDVIHFFVFASCLEIREREQEKKALSMSQSFRRKAGRDENREFTRRPVDIFTPEERDNMHSTRRSFNSFIIERFASKSAPMSPEDIVQECKNYFKRRHEDQIAKGHKRVSPWLNSTSSSLTKLKGEIKLKSLAAYSYRHKLHISKRELELLDRLNHRRLEENAHDLIEVDAKGVLKKLYELLDSEDPDELSVAISGLTGRRQSEVTHSITLDAPRSDKKYRYPSFWAHTTGFLKQRQGDRYAVKSRELPLLAPRPRLVGGINHLRDHWPSDDHKQASKLYAKKVSLCVKKHLSSFGIHKLHDLRKFFVMVAFEHFNERKASLPAFSSFVLGHKRKVSKRILTYLSMRVQNQPDLNWIFQISGCKLCIATPEQSVQLNTPEYTTPTTSSSDDEDEKVPQKPAPARTIPIVQKPGQSNTLPTELRKKWIMPRHYVPTTEAPKQVIPEPQTIEQKGKALAALF
jgi:hypothetical protein